MNLTHNWFKPGFVSTFGTLSGTITNDGSNLTGTSPGFLDPARPLCYLTAASPCRDTGASLHPSVLPAHAVTRQYQAPRAGVTRPNGLALHRGAYEFSPLEVWRFAAFGSNATNPQVTGDGADPDGDGAVNFEEFALATDPGLAEVPSWSTVGLAGGYLTLSYLRPEPAPPEVTYLTESSPDLATWCGDCTVGASVTGLPNGTARVTVQDTVPTASAPKRFLRLRLLRN